MKRIKLLIWYKYLRYKVNYNNWKLANRFDNLNARQQKGILAFKSALYNKKAKLFVNRTGDVSYIYVPQEKLFIKLSDKYMIIANGRYFDIALPEYEYKYLVFLYDKKLNRHRNQWEESILNNTLTSLDKLINKLQK